MVEATAAIALAVLATAGIAKIIDPVPTGGALAAHGLPSRIALVRILGITELIVAVLGLALGALAAAGSAVFYTGFTVFTLRSLRTDTPLQSCGCFGREDTPPSVVHVAYNVIAAATLTIVTTGGLSPIPQGSLTDTIAYLCFLGLGAFASVLLLTRLPTVMILGRSR